MRITINAPENLSEITLRQYQDFLNVEEPQTDDVVRIFMRLSQDTIDRIEKRKVEVLANNILQLFEKEPPMVTLFNYNGKRWGYIPKLDSISWGENRDAGAYLPNEENKWDNVHKAMAVFYRPVISERKGKYIIEKYKGSAEYSDELKDMPLSIAMGAYFFLLNLQIDLLSCTPDSIRKQLTEVELQMQVSLPSGGTTTNSTHSVREILEGLTKLPI